MELHLKYVETTCSFSGEHPPQPGQTYTDEVGTEWTVRTDGIQRALVMSETPVWDVRIGSSSPAGPITTTLKLKRKYSSEEIRNARQIVQDLGFSKVMVGYDKDICLMIELEEFKQCNSRLDLPTEIDGIPVKVVDLQR